jgi:hypothetical protein
MSSSLPEAVEQDSIPVVVAVLVAIVPSISLALPTEFLIR